MSEFLKTLAAGALVVAVIGALWAAMESFLDKINCDLEEFLFIVSIVGALLIGLYGVGLLTQLIISLMGS